MARGRGGDRDIDPGLTLLEVLTPDELALIGVPGDGDNAGTALGAEDFRLNAWDMYGPDWVDHIPLDINAAFHYFFGHWLWYYQLQIWYCPLPIVDIQVHGSRGSGKTEPMAEVAAMFALLYPGNDVIVAGPTKDQVLESKDAILTHGEHSRDGRDYTNLAIVHHRNAPQADIYLRPWDKLDPGSHIKFRSARGTTEAAELLRSAEAGWVFFDEFGREYDDATHLHYLAGCRRGPNHWRMNQNPEKKAAWQKMGFDHSITVDKDEREQKEIEIEEYVYKHDLAKQGFMCAYGNVGWNPWIWERYSEYTQPERFSVTWTSDMNAAFDRRQRAALVTQLKNDPRRLEMEMWAKRPPPPGNTFSQKQIDCLFDNHYTSDVKMKVEAGEQGYQWREYLNHGCIEFAVPPEYDEKGNPSAVYAGGGDPGTGEVGSRNSWNVYVVRIDCRPMQMVYFKQGNTSYDKTGSIKPWLTAVYHAVLTYPMMVGNFAAEASGPQKGVDEVAFDWAQVDDWEEHHKLVIWPLQMQQKSLYIQETQLILARATEDASKRLLVAPHIKLLESQLGEYLYPEPKGHKQDLVMGLVSTSAVLWQHCAREAAPKGWIAQDTPAAQPGQDAYQEIIEHEERHYHLANRWERAKR